MAGWYYSQQNQQIGPVDEAEIKRLVASGQLPADTMAWSEGQGDWQPISAIPSLSGGVPGGVPGGYQGYAPPGGYPQPGYQGTVPYQAPGAGQVPNHLVQAILVTIFCCLPFGIAAIVFAAQVNGKLAAGDYAGAVESSEKAKKFAWWGFGIGLVANIVVIILQVAAAQ